MAEEVWRDIVGYEGLYMVSNMGRVKSLNYNKCSGKEKVLKQAINGMGYYTVHLYKDKKGKTFTIHKLIAQAFIPNPKNKKCIDHINTIRTDNRIENLRWVTQKENLNNSLTRKNKSKSVMCIEEGKIFTSGIEAGEYYGVNIGSISNCCKGKRKSAGGYTWRFVD